ncbi:MAG TPA: penicillin-binding protein 2, partial [Bacillales bacterium]|nr:penicillin-binding protein 2 [Bacillales bacterium]
MMNETRKNDEDKEKENWYVNWSTKMIFPQLSGPKIEVHIKTLPAERGEIIDRKGRPLAVNGQQASVGIEPDKLKNDSKKKFADVAGLSMKEIESKLSASWVKPNYFVPIVKIPLDQKEKLSQLLAIPGVLEQKVPARIYPYHEAAGHLTGYIGPISAEELKAHENEGYSSSSEIGKSGLEAIFEKKLKADDGNVIYTTDADGNRLKTIAKKEPKNGETVRLTINAELQKRLYEEISKSGDVGTAAAINPKTGEVLALVTAPDFDPSTIHSNFHKLQSNPKNPLLNRFNQAYSPGSSFKPITAAIGLETGVLDPDHEMQINGPWQPNKSWGSFRVHRVDRLSSVNLRNALVYSDNIYFARTAYQIGEEDFLQGAKQFGFGQKLPSFPFPIEPAQVAGSDGFSGKMQLANSGYGQGKVLTSALQLTDAYTPFVNNGDLIKPTLLLNAAKSPQVWKKDVISKKTSDTIVNDLIQVVENP